jgi:hypothetical protein
MLLAAHILLLKIFFRRFNRLFGGITGGMGAIRLPVEGFAYSV